MDWRGRMAVADIVVYSNGLWYITIVGCNII